MLHGEYTDQSPGFKEIMADYRSTYEKFIYPLTNDSERERLARFLRAFIVLDAVAWIITAATNTPDIKMYLTAAANVIACLVFWACIRAGKMTAPRIGLPLLIIVSITFGAASAAGTHDIVVSGYLLAPLVAAFIFGTWGTIATFVLALGAYFFLFTLDVPVSTVPGMAPIDPLDEVNFLIIFTTNTIFIILFFRAVRWDLRAAVSSESAALDAKAKLAESEERYRLLANNATDVIWTIDLAGNTTYVSPSVENFIGYSVEENTALSIAERMTPESAEEALTRLRSELETAHAPDADYDRTVTIELEFNHKDGGTVWGELKAVVLRETDGTPTGVLGVTRNISERKAAEDQTQKMEALAAQADKLESVGVLAGGIAHDFNNLLMAIQANIDVARNSIPPGTEAEEPLGIAYEACEDAADLSSRLLTFSTGGEPIRQTVELRTAIRDSVGLAVSGSNVSTEFHIADDLWAANVDLSQIKQVFHNLAINAAQAMPQGGNLRVDAKNSVATKELNEFVPNGRYVHVHFHDEGAGIKQEDLERIFDPFFTTKDNGSGLGLATAYSIVKHHEGQISVQSKPGTGTTFEVYLPASEHEAAPIGRANPVTISGTGRILAMDDDATVRVVIGRLLKTLGFEFDLTANGDEALALYEAARTSGKPYDAVLLDLTIRGGMGGEETIRRLLELDPQVKAIVASGHSEKPIMANYQKFGFCGALAKPYKKDGLATVLNQALYKS
jgi:PAS domain S-box-containing protein